MIKEIDRTPFEGIGKPEELKLNLKGLWSIPAIEVFADWIGLESVSRLGTLSVQAPRGKEVFSFEYDAAWLRSDNNRILDPDLRLYRGPQYAGLGKPDFGLFLDSSPD